MSSAVAAAAPPDSGDQTAAAVGAAEAPAAKPSPAPPPPPPGERSHPEPAPPNKQCYVYEFTLAQPPHPSPEDHYAPLTPPNAPPFSNDAEAKLAILLGRRANAANAANANADRPPRLVPLTQRYQPHPHASGHPCTNCGISLTSTWRRLSATRELSCNSCSDYFRRRGRYRPVAGLPLRVQGVDLVSEGDTWARVVAARERGAAGGGEG